MSEPEVRVMNPPSPGQYAKAIVAGVTAFGAAYAVAAADPVVTTTEWVSIAVATIVSAVTVWVVPNQQPDEVAEQPEAESTPVGELVGLAGRIG
jgi:hypothetical protein